MNGDNFMKRRNPILFIYVGVSGSGKSTKALEVVTSSPEIYFELNRDNIRTKLFPELHRGDCKAYYNRPTSEINKDEELVTKTFFKTLEYRMGILKQTVICSDTNLHYNRRRDMENFVRKMGFKTATINIYISLEEAIERDSKRERNVGEEVIRKQYKNYEKFLKHWNERG